MENVKYAILAAAKLRFSHFGFAKTTVDEICRDCHISKKTLYQHFNSKDELLITLLTSELSHLQSMLLAQKQNNSDPLHRLSQFLQSVIVYLRKNYFFIQRIKEESHSPQSAKYYALLEKKLTTLMASIILDGKHQGHFRDLDETFVAYIGFNLLQILSYPHPIPKDTEMYTLIDVFINGLVPKSSANPMATGEKTGLPVS